MVTITKRDGSTEPFDRKKIERSIQKAGIDEATAETIAAAIPERSMTTMQIRTSVTDKLRERSDELADRYSASFRLRVKRSAGAVKGVALMAKETMDRLGMKIGEMLHLNHIGKQHLVRIEVDDNVGSREIKLHREDIAVLGANEGKKIAIRRKR